MSSFTASVHGGISANSVTDLKQIGTKLSFNLSSLANTNLAMDYENTLAPSGSDTLDFSEYFAKVSAILLTNTATGTGLLLNVGGAADPVPGFGTSFPLGPKGAYEIVSPVDGITVTPNTGCNFKIANPSGAASVQYRMVVLGQAVS